MSPRKKKSQLLPGTLRQWQDATVDFVFDVVVIFLIVFLVVRPFVVAPFQVKQQSMEPNIHDSEYILVAKLPYNDYIGWTDYQHGDIVVFRPQTNPETYLIKRVLGTPGDTLKIEDGHVWLQEGDEWIQQDESYLAARNQGNTCWQGGGNSCTDEAREEALTVTVPEDSYFVVGDNRLASRDSRSCFLGRCETETDRFVTTADIDGRALVVFFPFLQVRVLTE